MIMKASNNCIAIIKHYERFYANPYLCPVGKATIGYGSTYYENGKKVRLNDPSITEQEASELLELVVTGFENDVNKLVQLTLTQNQFDALVSFAYNVGSDIDADEIAEGLGDSTLLKLINSNIMALNTNYKKLITIEFCKWVNGTVKGKRIKLAGLVARRTTEALLFCDNVLKYFN